MFQQVVLCCDDQELGIRKKKKTHWDIFSPLRLNKGTPLLYFSARQEMDVASFGLNMEYKLSGMIKGMMRKEGMCECVSVWGRLTEVGLFEVKCFLKSWGFYFCLSVGLFFLLLIPAAHAVPCSMTAVCVCVWYMWDAGMWDGGSVYVWTALHVSKICRSVSVQLSHDHMKT